MYVLVLFCTAIAFPWPDKVYPEIPNWLTGESMRHSLGHFGVLVLMVGVLMGILTGINGFYLATSRLMDDVAEAAGVTLYRSPTGEANVAEAMGRHGCLFGGEGGGGAIDPRVVTVRDSFVAMGLMLNAMAAGGRTVSQLVEQLPRYTMLKDKFPCPDEHAGPILAAVRDELAGRPGARVNEEDGLRVDLPEGWVQIRTSNTEPLMRITAEAADESAARDLAEQVRRIADRIVGT
jgi:phosphomannomutase